MKIRKRTWTRGGKTQTGFFMDYYHPVTKKRCRHALSATTKQAATLEAASEWVKIKGNDNPGSCTLGWLLEQHRNRHGIEPSTRLIETRQGNNLIRGLGVMCNLQNITTHALDQYVDWRASESRHNAKPASNATIKKEIALLKQAMRWGSDRNYCIFPAFRTPTLKVTRKKPRFLTPEELSAFINAAGPYFRNLIEFAFYSGMRRSELFRLKWSDVDFKNNRILVHTKKSGRATDTAEDFIFLPPQAMDLLDRHKKLIGLSHEFVFGASGTHTDRNGFETVEPWNIERKLKAIAKRAGIADYGSVSLRTLRHSCATAMLNSGATVPEAAAHLRHRDGGALLLRTYAHAHESGIRNAVNSLDLGTVKAQTKEPKTRK